MMNHNKKLQMIIKFILCFVVFFSLGNSVNAVDLDETTIYQKIMSQLTKSLVSFGDGVLHIVAGSVGESVTIDKLIYNDVGKLSIDYWDDINDSSKSGTTPIKSFMQEPLKKWYGVFFKIAMMVYMMVLVYIGIATMLASTAQKKASYKQLFVTWFMGITILIMFPYVMKYIIIVNDSFVDTLQAKAQGSGYIENSSGGTLAQKGFLEIQHKYGEDEFVDELGVSAGDVMVITRTAAQKGTDEAKDSDITLAIVYLILIGQMLAILVMYYKRAFMVAFLITIFPLVAMTYALDKIGDGKNQSFNTWFKEFVINVIIQMFHAVVYLLVTGAGVKLYIDNGGQNFLFMVLCVLFLFEGEKILRTIFNMKSQASSIGDLAASGALVWGAATNVISLTKKKDDDIGNAKDKRDVSEANTRQTNRRNRAQEENKAAIAALDEKRQAGESTDSHGEYQGVNNEPEGVKVPEYDEGNAKDTVLGQAMQRRLKAGMFTKGVKFGAGVVGGTLGAAQGLATKGDLSSALAGASAGSDIAKTVTEPLAKGVNKLEQVYHGHKVSNAILNKQMDSELGIKNIGAVSPAPTLLPDGSIADVDSADIESRMDSVQEIYRKALAAQARATARGGKDAGEIAYYKYLEKHLEK